MSECRLSCYAARSAKGYAICWWEGKNHYHHRLVYAWHNNVTIQSIAGKIVMHTCDNPRCMNPLHLKLGTHADNVADKISKGRGSGGGHMHKSYLTRRELK